MLMGLDSLGGQNAAAVLGRAGMIRLFYPHLCRSPDAGGTETTGATNE